MQQLLNDLTVILGLDNTSDILILCSVFMSIVALIYLIKKLI